MSDTPQEQNSEFNEAEDFESPSDGGHHVDLPHDLPPVEPPSAGMIVQLFIVPAVIVAIVVGVYTLFGQLASQELDWRQLVTDVKSENPHVRWRGALGLAQMLDADAQRGENSQDLDSNPEIASALSELYVDRIKGGSPNEETIKQVEFLSKALGRMDVQDAIFPAFLVGIEEQRDREVRKHSMTGLAMTIGQVRENGEEIKEDDVLDRVIEISKEPDSLMRDQSAYILGLLATDEANTRLEVLLEDANQKTRVNAAIGFARNGSLQGMPVFEEVLKEAPEWKLDPSTVQTQPDEEQYFERMLMLINSLKAIERVSDQLSDEQSAELAGQLQTLADSTKDNVLRTEALKLIHALKG